jgi:hypothetical protein
LSAIRLACSGAKAVLLIDGEKLIDIALRDDAIDDAAP